MTRFPFFQTQFGDPKAPKRALLLHGLMGSGVVWYKVAAPLVEAGYRVDCPDLTHHGFGPSPSSFTLSAAAEHLAEYLKEPYDIVAGVSFGAPIAALLFPLLAHKPSRLVLIEPGLDVPPWPRATSDKMVSFIQSPLKEEEIAEMQPTWSREEVVFRKLSMLQTEGEVVREWFKQVMPHSILPSPSDAARTEVVILAADREKGAVYPADEHAPLLARDHPHVQLGKVVGGAHDLHKGKPEVVAAVLLGGLQAAKEVTILRDGK